MSQHETGANFLAASIHDFKMYKNLGDKAIERLSEEEMHWTPSPESNSMAVLILHMAGNMRSRWTDFLTTDGEKPDRNRDTEFEDTQKSKEELSKLWNEGWNILFSALEPITGDMLLNKVTIRQQPLTIIEAVSRQVAHYSYHVGQMVYLAKQIRDKDFESLSIPKGNSAAFNSNPKKY
jgi:uncharacterized damage-inducible protein DinB